jgi:hypothetical protein
MSNKNLYQWLFHFNPYKEIWFAFKREDYVKFFNGDTEIKTVGSKNINTLIELVEKTDGDVSKLLNLE